MVNEEISSPWFLFKSKERFRRLTSSYPSRWPAVFEPRMAQSVEGSPGIEILIYCQITQSQGKKVDWGKDIGSGQEEMENALACRLDALESLWGIPPPPPPSECDSWRTGDSATRTTTWRAVNY